MTPVNGSEVCREESDCGDCEGKAIPFLLTLNSNDMKVKIEFKDKNRSTISIHYIEYETFTPPYIGIVEYCRRIVLQYSNVYFYDITEAE